MPTITINGREFVAESGQTVLQVAQANGIDIPTFCNHESLEPFGACRLCIVEVTPKGRTRSRIVVSCMYPIEEGLNILTDSPRVIENRRMLLDLLLARCSENKQVKAMAAKYGIDKSSFPERYLERNDCILCGLCARVCSEVVGVSAISLVNRGITKWAASPFFEPAPDCIGCGSCYYICPTGAIKMEEKDGVRTLVNWKREFKLSKCPVCGNYWLPEAQLEWISKKTNVPLETLRVCTNCRK